MVRATLGGRRAHQHDGTLHVWLLPTGDDEQSQGALRRTGRAPLHPQRACSTGTAAGRPQGETKHGNYNAWLAAARRRLRLLRLRRHRPRARSPNFLERMLGFTSATDVAFVDRARRSTATDTSAVTKAAESQQFLFHALIQRAGSLRRPDVRRHQRTSCASRPVHQIGGSVRLRSPRTWRPASRCTAQQEPRATGHHWRLRLHARTSLAVGEGPRPGPTSSRSRCAGRAARTRRCLKQVLEGAVQHAARAALQRTRSMLVYYPMTAVNWFLGVPSSCVLFLWLGALRAPRSPRPSG